MDFGEKEVQRFTIDDRGVRGVVGEIPEDRTDFADGRERSEPWGVVIEVLRGAPLNPRLCPNFPMLASVLTLTAFCGEPKCSTCAKESQESKTRGGGGVEQLEGLKCDEMSSKVESAAIPWEIGACKGSLDKREFSPSKPIESPK